MDTQTIEGGNRLIAEFMGYKYFPNHTLDGIKGVYRCGGKEPMNIKEFKYHSSWDWLMHVVEKIEDIKVNGIDYEREVEWQFSVEIMNMGCVIHRDVLPQYWGTETDFLKLYDCEANSKIYSTWLAVIQFIQWYNTTNP